MMTALDVHPDAFRGLVLNNEVDAYNNTNIVILREQEKKCLVVSKEPGTTFEYMKCDFKAKKYSFVTVVHYQLLIDEKVYWQSFKTEDDFFEFWELLQ